MLVCSGPISKKKKNYFGRLIHLHMNLGRHFLGEFDFFCQQLFCFQNKLLSALFIDLVTFYSSVDTS